MANREPGGSAFTLAPTGQVFTHMVIQLSRFYLAANRLNPCGL
jgi:hypothetical protein